MLLRASVEGGSAWWTTCKSSRNHITSNDNFLLFKLKLNNNGAMCNGHMRKVESKQNCMARMLLFKIVTILKCHIFFGSRLCLILFLHSCCYMYGMIELISHCCRYAWVLFSFCILFLGCLQVMNSSLLLGTCKTMFSKWHAVKLLLLEFFYYVN